MKKNEVKIGGIYIAKVTNRLVQVRINAESRYGGWDALNLLTRKKVRVRSAAKLRSAVVSPTAATGGKKDKDGKKAKATPKTQLPPTSTPTIETVATTDTKPAASDKQTKAEKKPKRLSGLDAAAKVLEETGETMNVKEIVELAEQKGYWKSPGGKTPWATVYSAIIREISKKGSDSRFRKAERGRFAHA